MPEKRIELPICCLRNSCITTMLLWLTNVFVKFVFFVKQWSNLVFFEPILVKTSCFRIKTVPNQWFSSRTGLKLICPNQHWSRLEFFKSNWSKSVSFKPKLIKTSFFQDKTLPWLVGCLWQGDFLCLLSLCLAFWCSKLK